MYCLRSTPSFIASQLDLQFYLLRLRLKSLINTQQQLRRNSYDSIGLLVEEVKPPISLDPASFTALVVQLTTANRRRVLQVLVFQEAFEPHLNRLSNCLAPNFSFNLFPFFIAFSLYLSEPLSPCLLLLSFLFHFLLLLFLRLRKGLRVSPFWPPFKSVHPTLGKLASQQALITRLPVIDHGNWDGYESGDAERVADCKGKDLLLSIYNAVKGLSKRAKVSVLCFDQAHYVFFCTNPQSLAGRIGKYFRDFQ